MGFDNDGNGDMIGRYDDSKGATHMFFKKRHSSPTSGFSPIADPVVGATVKEGGINNFGRICGTYNDQITGHGDQGFCEDAP